MSELDRTSYAQQVLADVLATADAENATAPEIFTRRVLDDLEQAGEVENTFVAYHRTHGVEINGYGETESLGSMDLFITLFRQQPLEDKVNRAQVEALFKRLTNFVARCRDGLRKDIDESSDVYDMCLAVEKELPEARRLRLFLLTNTLSTTRSLPTSDLDGMPVSYEIWDLARLHRMATSGTLSEPIVVDFEPALPCLATPETDRDYSVFLAIMPGQELARLYGQYATRLLELNVRSFLQTKVAVNKGIRETLLTSPERFLAYNNGITATASKVDFITLPDGGRAISRIHDLQIVNGGQTTASIHNAYARDEANISDVFVQMKLTVVSPDRLQEIVPEISKYSNTQNKVTVVDFSSNHPFHVAVEKVTRSLWAPAVDGSGQETKWFYERARGQYADALVRERTPANVRKFKIIHPTRQKFTKSDAAKFIHSWGKLPHIVSRGAEKNFREFMMTLGDGPTVDTIYCQHLIAKAILFRSTEKIVSGLQFGGYRSNIVTYAIARLAAATDGRLDFDRIWREQGLSESLAAAIEDLCVPVRDEIINPRYGNHVGEWAKRPDCWASVQEIDWTIPAELEDELVRLRESDTERQPYGDVPQSIAATGSNIDVPAADWFAVARWAKETQNLKPWQRQIAVSVGRYINNDWTVSDKMATQAVKLMSEARSLGFKASVDL
jgi:hypothetical protein